MASGPAADALYRAISTAVDAGFYRAVYEDIEASGHDPVGHYAEAGWREGRDPAPWFSTAGYLDDNPDVAEAGINPLHHYLTAGRGEGRSARPSELRDRYLFDLDGGLQRGAWSFQAAGGEGDAGMLTALDAAGELQLVAGHLDRAFYLAAYPDIAEAGIDPVEHYVAHGWREGRDPTPLFSTNDYLELNLDVDAAGINPFVHYVTVGRREGRPLRRDLGFRYEVILRLHSMAERLAPLDAGFQRPDETPEDVLRAALAETRATDGALHVTFSHDDYSTNVGGIQLCIQREAARVAAQGRDHLHLHPLNPYILARLGQDADLFAVLWNGRTIGRASPATLARLLGERTGQTPTFAVHSLLGHSPEDVIAVLKGAGAARGYFWIHDFASVCAGYHLMRNDVKDCGAPPADSAACTVCVYGDYRARHVEAHRRLFEGLNLTVVAPSETALATWRKGTDLPHEAALVAPHARLVPGEPASAIEGPLRVAFLGSPAVHKGWMAFRELALKLAGDPRYEFRHLGAKRPAGSPIDFHPVTVTADDPLAMRDAVDALSVDLAIIWPLCRETFCFTAYEALAGGAAILTNPDSGNVAALVAGEASRGRVLEDERALIALFESGDVLALARARRRPSLHGLVFGDMTADLLEAR